MNNDERREMSAMKLLKPHGKDLHGLLSVLQGNVHEEHPGEGDKIVSSPALV